MRHFNSFCCVLLALLAWAPIHADRLKLMTYNIHHAEGMDKVYSPERIAKVIMEDSPDVVALQEVDSVSRRVNGHYVAGDIAKLTDMVATYAEAIPLQGGKYGVALLSKQAPQSVRRIPLPGQEEKRVILIADFGKYVVCCTHLSLTEGDRINSIPIIRRALKKYKRKPIFIMGDFNDTPSSVFMQKFARHFQALTSKSVPTFPYNQPREVIDYIMTRQGTGQPRAIRSHITIGNIASDHCPLMTEVEY